MKWETPDSFQRVETPMFGSPKLVPGERMVSIAVDPAGPIFLIEKKKPIPVSILHFRLKRNRSY